MDIGRHLIPYIRDMRYYISKMEKVLFHEMINDKLVELERSFESFDTLVLLGGMSSDG